ncbi:MAG: peptide deformylase [Flavobacteriales bacterium]
MTRPIVAYGDPVLKRRAEAIDLEEAGSWLGPLIEDMYETLYNAHGVGLAAPQIGESLRLFITDASAYADQDEEMEPLRDFKEVFINPEIIEEEGDEWRFEEGCLSIPNIREEVSRSPIVRIRYYDRDLRLRDKRYQGLAARIVQHEYDHIEGILFTDHLRPLKKRLLKRKLKDISEGKVDVAYRMRFPSSKKVKR